MHSETKKMLLRIADELGGLESQSETLAEKEGYTGCRAFMLGASISKAKFLAEDILSALAFENRISK